MKHSVIMLLMAVCAVTALWAGNREKYTGSYNYQRALEAYGEGKYDDCQRYIDKELDENPENGYAHLMLAGVALENDDLSTALTSMGCCIKYLGDDTETLAKAHKLRKDMRLEMGDTIKALDDISESIKLCPLNDEYYGDRALLYRGMGQRDKAEADYRKVIELKKDSYEGYFGLSLTYFDDGRYDDALELLNQSLATQDVDTCRIYANIAHAYHTKGELDKADDYLIRTIGEHNEEMNGDIISILSVWGRKGLASRLSKLEAHAQTCSGSMMCSIALAVEYGFDCQFAKQIDCLKMLNENDESAVLCGQIADAYLAQGNCKAAMEYIDKALALAPEQLETIEKKVMSECLSGNYDKGIETATKMIEIAPDNHRGYYLRSVAEAQAGNYGAAIDDCEMANILVDDMYFDLGEYYLKNGEKERAEDYFRSIIEHDPGMELGCTPKVYVYLGDNDKAIETDDALLAAHPDDPDSYYKSASMYALMGNNAKAMEQLRKAFEMGAVNIAMTEGNPYFKSLRPTAQFKALMDEYRNR